VTAGISAAPIDIAHIHVVAALVPKYLAESRAHVAVATSA